jgi:heme/copper-type cytochrome/quinol oxidase subunit 2
MKTKYIIILALLLLVIAPAEAQCAMCRAVLESEEGQGTAKGVNDGIVYLMVIPYLIVGGLGYFIYKILSKKEKSTK